MKTTPTLFVLALLIVSVAPAVVATDVGADIGVEIITEDFEPLVWNCGGRIMYDDSTEPGRLGAGELLERINNYAFTGEKISWRVLVLDKNGYEKIADVYATIGSTAGTGNDIEVNCQFDHVATTIDPDCNARIGEEILTGDHSQVAAYYDCTLTVETPDSMADEYWVTVEAEDIDGLLGAMAEQEYWFFNPEISLSVDSGIVFEYVRPGTSAYSSPILVGNEAEAGSGVMLDMFISGTDFYDSESSGAMCPTTNELILGDGDSYCDVGPEFGGSDTATDPFCFKVTNANLPAGTPDDRQDTEGYIGINYGIGFHNPNSFYGLFNGDGAGYEMVQGPMNVLYGNYFGHNLLSPGAEHSVVFRLNLPEPCNGDFDSGSLFFWGEAI
jgi:hypothetical protein